MTKEEYKQYLKSSLTHISELLEHDGDDGNIYEESPVAAVLLVCEQNRIIDRLYELSREAEAVTE